VAVAVDVLVGVNVGVNVGVAVEVWLAVGVTLAVAVGVRVVVVVGVAVFVGVVVGGELAVAEAVGVRVGVDVGRMTLKMAFALVEMALVANAFTVFVKVWADGGLPVALTVIVALAPMARLGIRTSKLDAVSKVTVPAVVVTLPIASHDGKSVSFTTIPLALYDAVLVTVIVYVTGLETPGLIAAGLTVLVKPSTVPGENGQLSVALLKLFALVLVANQ